MNEYGSPQRENVGRGEKDLGSTQLRKHIFKKHYSEKIKEMGHQ